MRRLRLRQRWCLARGCHNPVRRCGGWLIFLFRFLFGVWHIVLFHFLLFRRRNKRFPLLLFQFRSTRFCWFRFLPTRFGWTRFCLTRFGWWSRFGWRPRPADFGLGLWTLRGGRARRTRGLELFGCSHATLLELALKYAGLLAGLHAASLLAPAGRGLFQSAGRGGGGGTSFFRGLHRIISCSRWRQVPLPL